MAKWIPLLILNEGIILTGEEWDVLNLTPKEQAWGAQKHPVGVRVVDFPPYMIIDENKVRTKEQHRFAPTLVSGITGLVAQITWYTQ